MPLLVAELEGRAVQRVPQLQSVVTAAQAFTPVPLAFPAGLATQLYPAWVGGQASGAMWEPTGPLPLPRILTNEVVSCAQVIVPYGHQQCLLGQLLPWACIEELLQGRGQKGRKEEALSPLQVQKQAQTGELLR